MADATGTVESFQVTSGGLYKARVVRDNGTVETVVWGGIGDGLIRDRVLETTWVAMFREAVVAGKEVSAITENANSNRLSTLSLFAAKAPRT